MLTTTLLTMVLLIGVLSLLLVAGTFRLQEAHNKALEKNSSNTNKNFDVLVNMLAETEARQEPQRPYDGPLLSYIRLPSGDIVRTDQIAAISSDDRNVLIQGDCVSVSYPCDSKVAASETRDRIINLLAESMGN